MHANRGRRAVVVRAATALVALAGLAACTTAPTRSSSIAPVADAAFRAEGRISARHVADAVSASFRWDHAPPKDDLELFTPLGQTVARLAGDASVPFAWVETSDGKVLEASDWASLTMRALGFPLPVGGLSAWMRGAPRAGSAFEAETDAQGRPRLIRQDGWEITLDYSDDARRGPSRLRLVYPDVEVRLALDRLD